MRKIKANFFFLLLFLCVSSAFARFVWINFAHNSAATFFYDPGTLKKNKELRIIWILANYTNPTRSGELSAVVKQEFDCKRARYRIIKLKSHSKKNGKGKVLTKFKGRDRWKMVVSGSPDADLMKIICTN